MTLEQLRSTQLSDFTGVNPFFILDFINKNKIDSYALLQGVALKEISKEDFVTALIGTPKNELQNKLISKYKISNQNPF